MRWEWRSTQALGAQLSDLRQAGPLTVDLAYFDVPVARRFLSAGVAFESASTQGVCVSRRTPPDADERLPGLPGMDPHLPAGPGARHAAPGAPALAVVGRALNASPGRVERVEAGASAPARWPGRAGLHRPCSTRARSRAAIRRACQSASCGSHPAVEPPPRPVTGPLRARAPWPPSPVHGPRHDQETSLRARRRVAVDAEPDLVRQPDDRRRLYFFLAGADGGAWNSCGTNSAR